MTRLVFIVPAYQRFELTRLCLEELVETCAELGRIHRIDATAVVIADDENLKTASELGFWGVEQENVPLGRKFNDGIECAVRRMGADYVTPIGTDNWASAAMISELPQPHRVVARRNICVIREDGKRMCDLEINYDGGDGIRTFPVELFEPARFRPAAEHARRAVDTSIVERLRRLSGWKGAYDYQATHPMDTIGFQSADFQLNGYDGLKRQFGKREFLAPWERLATHWDSRAVDRMREYYERKAAAR